MAPPDLSDEDMDAGRTDVADRELEVWDRIWATPQAVAWARLGWTHEVALYVRLSVMAECGDMKAASEMRQWSDRLGLNPSAMMRNRWRVVRDQVADRRSAAAKVAPAASKAMRDRLKAVDSGGS